MELNAATIATAAVTFVAADFGLAFESAFESLGFAGGGFTWPAFIPMNTTIRHLMENAWNLCLLLSRHRLSGFSL
mgnify:CR=1 FL=1